MPRRHDTSRLRRVLLAFCLLLACTPAVQAGSVRLEWNPNPEPDIAGYVLVWGTASGVYTNSVSLGPGVLTHEVADLPSGTYFFAIRAFNTAGLHSPYSNEATATVTGVVPAPTVSSLTPLTGPTTGGTPVTLSGTGFLAGATVTVGGTAATVTALTSTTITAVTPAHAAGAASVVVTNPGGLSATAPSSFTYQPPAPTVTSLTPLTGPTTGGTPVTLSGTGFLAGATVTVGGTAATVTALTGTTITAVTPAHAAGAASVVVTNPGGLSATAPSSFTYQPPAPTVTSLTPLTGPTTGGTPVTLSGTGFLAGATVTVGGTAATVTALTGTTITAVTPAHAAGAASVVVTNPGGLSATAPSSFTYQPPAPTVTSLTPLTGPTTGGTPVTLSGTGFLAGATVTVGGTAATVTALTSTTITAVTPAHAAGAASVVVTNPGGLSATAPSSFTYQPPAPTVTSLTPLTGPTTGGTPVTLSGTGFLAGATVTVGGTAATVTALTGTTITAVTPAHAAGAASVVVTNPGGLSATAPSSFTYQPPAPTVTSLTPLTGPTTGGTPVTLSGTGFLAGATVTVGGTAATVTALTGTTITAVTPAHAAGAASVVVTNPGGLSATAPSSFTYQPPAPTVTSLTPLTGPTTGGTPVTLSGTGFLAGATVTVGGTAATVTALTSTTITAVTPAHAAGAASVVVTNPGGLSATAPSSFTYQPPAPTVTSLTPLTGPTTGGTPVTLSGTGFLAGATVTVGGTAATVTALTGTTITAVTPAHAAGAASVVVTNPGGLSATAPSSFTYQPPAPTVTSLTPLTGPTTGGTPVTLSGTGFLAGATVTVGGTAATVTALTGTTITAVTPAHAAGAASVVVTNPGGLSATAPSSFTYQPPAPTVTSLTPLTGPTTGGTPVTLSGTGFLAGATVTVGGTAATVTALTGTTITAVTPAHAAGAASVVVTNPGGLSATAPSSFTYQPPAPTVTSLTPLTGPTTGGTPVTLSGTGFLAGATVTVGGTAATVTALTGTTITAVTPAHAAGAASVVVTNPGGLSATAPSSFTYQPPAPTVTSLTPTTGPVAGGTEVTISGSNFKLGAVVRFGTLNATLVSVAASRLVVRTPAQAEGEVSVTVINSDGSGVQLPAAFTYRAAAPTISSVSPARGPAGGNTDVTIIGANFQTGASVSVDDRVATVLSTTSTRLVVRMPAHVPAVVGLTVTNPDSQSVEKPNAYTYVEGGPAVTQILPDSGPLAGGNTVTILGSGFVNAVVSFDGVGAAVLSRTAEMLTVRVPARPAGTVDVVVSNSDGMKTTAPGAYAYLDPNAPFVRYFAEGASGSFFRTRFALANPHAEEVPVTVTFTDTQGTPTTMAVTVPARSRTTIDETNRPGLASDAFATKFEAPRVVGVERTMAWAAGGPTYGAHSETGVTAPRTSWVLAEGATIGGFNTFYLLQNPTTEAAQVKVQYLLSTGQRIEKIHPVAPLSRTNVWVNKDDPALAAAEMSATITSLNGVPVVVERSMYRNTGNELFTAGHNSAAVEAPALRWFLAEGATGGTFDEFVLVANPNAAAATLRVSYLRAGKAPLVKTYTAAPQSRLTIWVDQEAPELASAEVSVVVESVTPTPVVVERSMWWRATPEGDWTEAHNNRAVTTTAARWLVADGESGGAGEATTYVLVANAGASAMPVTFTLLTEDGEGRSVQDTVSANGRFSMDVAGTFPEARGRRFSVLVEASSSTAALVVERASYSSTPGIPWAAGTNSLALPLP